jgi:electron transfer flavoprotein alpha subunit
MKNKKILVLAKFYKGELNPFDGSALECALQTGCQDITVLTMSSETALEPLKALTRLGVKAVLVSDKAYAGSDTLATSRVLCKAVKKINPDLIFCGRQSVDGDTAQVPIQLAKRLNFQLISGVMKLDENSALDRAGMRSTIENRQVLAFEKAFTLRFPSIFSKIKDVEIWDNTLLQIPENECGQKGSPTRVIKSYESTIGRRFCQFIPFSELEKQIEKGLQESREERVYQGEKTKRVYYVGNVKALAENIGVNAVCLQGKSAEEIALQIQEKQAKIVLFSDEERTKRLASEVAVLLSAGLCADCTGVRIENGQFIMTRPALGGNITADIVCDSKVAMATVRTRQKQGAEIVFGVGRGTLNALSEIKKLAKKHNAEICCSRTVVDMNAMPYECQVGLTGRTIAPKVYVAFGISGAVQHTCAIEGATKIIAVNHDKNARIFDYADYGIIKEV